MFVRILTLLSALFVFTNQQCNATLMQFFTEYSLGRQDEENRTFTKISERVQTLNNVSYVSNTNAYKISNIKPKFFYIDSQQRAYISDNTDLITIYGGYLSVTYTFDWTKSSGLSGSGIAIGKSDQIQFTKEIKLNSSYAFEELYDYKNITFFKSKTNITRISPATITDTDFDILQNMFNRIDNVNTVKTETEDQIDKIYSYYLNLSLYQEKRIIDTFFQYKWKSPTSYLNIEYEVQMKKIILQKEGLQAIYMQKIANYSQWQCEHDVPELHINPAVYGSQQFITFDVLKNTLRYAIDMGTLNTDLNRRNWESRFFQFFAGDLYQIIPKLAELYYASQPVLGNCKVLKQGLNIKKSNHDTLNVTMNANCELGIGRQKIAGFSVALQVDVQIIPSFTNISFVVTQFNFSATYQPDSKFNIVNKELADHMIMHSLNRLKEGNVFGSGWPIYSKDHPHIIVEEDYIIIYDSTHVDPNSSLLLQAQTEL